MNVSAVDSITGRGLTVPLPEKAMQKFYVPVLSALVIQADPAELEIAPCQGENSAKIARIALKYLFYDDYQKGSRSNLLKYYAGHFYVPELKMRAERELIKSLDQRVTAENLRRALQCALVGKSPCLSCKSLGELVSNKTYEELDQLLNATTFLIEADEVIGLVSRIKRHVENTGFSGEAMLSDARYWIASGVALVESNTAWSLFVFQKKGGDEALVEMVKRLGYLLSLPEIFVEFVRSATDEN